MAHILLFEKHQEECMPEDNVEKENAKEVKEKKKKGGFKFILIVVFVVFCLGLGGTYFFYGNVILAKIFKKTAQEGEKRVERKIGPIMSLEPFLFNIAGNSSRFAKISLGIEMKDIKSMEEAKNMTLLIRDRILSVLGSKNIEVLMDVNSRDAIKQELLTSLKGIFKKPDEINAIYITDFIIQ